ncbi:MAG: hypothetical protein U0R52_08700 [Solirubrobacterales bacterium]
MLVGVIDIGSNTTRLLVAEVSSGRPSPRLERRHFLTPEASGSQQGLCDLVERQAAVAREFGAEELVVAGTASLRQLRSARSLDRVCERAGAGGLRVLSAAQEARLAFLGATACEWGELPDTVGVADVGGGSTQIVVGAPGSEPHWWASRPVGSRNLTRRAQLSDPPSRDQIGAARNAAARRLVGVEPPRCGQALAVGGGTSSLRRISGGSLDRHSIAGMLERLQRQPSIEVAADLGLAPERVRLLPAALAVLEAVCELLPEPLRVARGGIREGLALERALASGAEVG